MTPLMRVVRKRGIQPLLFAAAISLLATGCRTYEQQNRVIQYWHQGNLTSAAAEATKMAGQNANNKDAIVWRLEQGAVLRGNGQCEASNKAFDQAQDRIDQYSQEAKVKIGNEAGALLSNQANLPYTGRAYDGIMLNTYKALNYLQLGETDKARVELIRAYQRQQDAVADNQRRIEKVQGEAAKSKDKAAMDKAQQDPKFKDQMQGAYTGLDNLQAYANYVNPFTVYLDGLYFMADAVDASDLERARKSFERIVGFDPDNEYVKQDLATVDDLMNGKPLPPTTYVIFETGCAPVRGQIRIDIPIIVTRVSYVGAAFPTLKPQGDYLPSLTVTANGTNATTSLVASMDSVIGLDFKNELPIVITKTIASTVAKAVAAYAVNAAANQQNSWLGLASQIGTAVAQAAVNIADERTWTTLPKQFQVCRIPTPSDRKIELETPGGGQRIPVTIEDGAINIVYVKSITATSPLLVTQIKLK
ncbi:MAG: COG3014 family protein [Limisphaerales bacterium]